MINMKEFYVAKSKDVRHFDYKIFKSGLDARLHYGDKKIYKLTNWFDDYYILDLEDGRNSVSVYTAIGRNEEKVLVDLVIPKENRKYLDIFMLSDHIQKKIEAIKSVGVIEYAKNSYKRRLESLESAMGFVRSRRRED